MQIVLHCLARDSQLEFLGNEQQTIVPFIRNIFDCNFLETHSVFAEIGSGKNFRFHEPVFLMNQFYDVTVPL